MKTTPRDANDLPPESCGHLPTILVAFGESWGAVDWILPVLCAAKERGLARVCAYFHHEAVLHGSGRYEDLAGILNRVAAEIHTPDSLVAQLPLRAKLRLLAENCLEDVRTKRRPLRAAFYLVCQLAMLPFRRRVFRAKKVAKRLLFALLADRFQLRPVDVLFEDPDILDFPAFCEEFPRAKVIVFPHGTNWIEDHEYSPGKIRRMRQTPEHATWLTGLPSEAQHLRKNGLDATITACGHPKYDPDWIANITSQASGTPRGRRRDASRPLTMLLLARPRKKLADESAFRPLIRAIFQVAAKHELRVVVKLHPRQPRREITRELDRADRGRIEWCNTSVLGAAAAADFVVALPTSAVMDAVAVGSPVFEFFDYSKDRHCTYVKAGGETTSIYRREKMVVPVDTEAELDAAVTRIRESPEWLDEIAATQQAVLNRLLGSQQSRIDGLLSLLELGRRPKWLPARAPRATSRHASPSQAEN